MPIKPALPIFLLILAGCGGGAPDPAVEGSEQPGTEQPDARAPAAGPGQRPDSVTDTLMVEGMPEPMALRLFRTPADFPLRFSAYVPADMARETAEDGAGASVRFVAEFGGVRNDRALIHMFVHPGGTDPQEALAMVRAYQAGTGVPVSRGLEPLDEADTARRMPWADHAYAFRYQAGGTWYLGSIGLGTRDDRLFHIVTHYPGEYGDGFAPRSSMIFDTWRWADGSPLRDDSSRITIPSERPD